MGLSSLPAQSEGVLCIILVNTAMSISIFKGIIRTILHIVGIIASPSSSPSQDYNPQNSSESFEIHLSPSDDFIEEFRSRTPTLRFDSVCSGCKEPEHDCSVCLTQFEPESEINYCISCGHVFHKVCLEKWLDYWNITCPLCRSPLIPEDDASCLWAMIEACTKYLIEMLLHVQYIVCKYLWQFWCTYLCIWLFL